MVQPSAQHERIIPRFLQDEMRDSFIDYSMSVIVQRALPDARDGLKPVHRRILFAMYELGLFPDRDYKKSATVVGDVLGKYHPHGDSAVYDTLVRMAQEFSLRYPLVDGQGNFGSVDGDSAAAYRYTEARLAPIATELLTDIQKETVDFTPNFDDRLLEPSVLPTRLPQLLLNGIDGIAVGMATKIPPHNLSELLDATDHLVADPDCEVDELMEHVLGPDFPTGGYIWGRDAIDSAYREGRGRVEMRARMHLEEGNYGKSSLVVTELPYQVNKSRVIEQITRQVRRGRLGEITDLRDESDRDGIRLVIELKRDAEPRKLLKTLFKKTQLRYTFGVITLALVDGKPEELDLKEALECFVDHRLEVIGRRAAHELEKSEERAHLVEGLLTALDRIDRVIELIRGSESVPIAREKLRSELELSEPQADAILAMRLSRLTGLERKNLEEELVELEEKIEEYRQLVDDEGYRRQHMRADLRELRAHYGDPRRTEIVDDSEDFPLPSGGEGQATLVLVSRRGYIKAQPARSGSGLAGAEAMAERERDFVRRAFFCRASDTLLVVTRRGQVHALAVSDLPRGTRSSRGRPLAGFLEMEEGDGPAAVLSVEAFPADRYLLTVSREGQVKRTALEEYANIRSGGIIGAGLEEGDEVIEGLLVREDSEVLLASRQGQAIRFETSDIRPMGRSARGVKGIDLAEGDAIVAAMAPRRDAQLLAATAGGFGKRLPFTEIRLQGRAGKGSTILPERESTGELIGLLEVRRGDATMWELASGEITLTPTDDVPTRARNEASRRVIEGAAEDPVVSVHLLRANRPETGGEEAETARDAGAPDRMADSGGQDRSSGSKRGAGAEISDDTAEGQGELELTEE